MIDILKENLTLFVIFPVVILFGSYLSVRLRLIQITKLPKALLLVTEREKQDGISSFAALSAVLGGNLGTGNISGVAVAIVTGGPGALFWMWVMAILASLTKYVECFLGVHFQEKDPLGEWVGGPMYYLHKGLQSKLLAKIFCLFTITSALSVGNIVQVHALTLPLHELDIHPLYLGLPLAFLVGGVIWGGLRRFASVASAVVPFMAITYVGASLLILFLNRGQIAHSFALIFSSAFSLKPLASGALGYGILSAIRAGFDRGLFATDSGIGLAPILHGAVHDPHPEHDNRIKQGLISILSPMIVMVVCTMTGLVLLSTGVHEKLFLPSTSMCMDAFRVGLNSVWAGHIVTITLFFFAFTTILTWSFCADKAVEFLFGPKLIHYFQLIFIMVIPIGALLRQELVWTLADISINFMFIINMTGVILLSNMVITESRLKKIFK